MCQMSESHAFSCPADIRKGIRRGYWSMPKTQAMAILIKELSPFESPALERHFVALKSEDRRLRFGAGLNDHAVRLYVKRIDFERDALFGVLDDELNIIAAAHLARTNGHAELGVSVLPGHRARGIGGALLRRAQMHARNWGVQALFIHCLTENSAMMHLARKQDMDIVTEAGETEAWLKLLPADASTYLGAVFEQRVALFDYALKSQIAGARRVAGATYAGALTGSRSIVRKVIE
jgi:GNAT superfamily N-acetyltransferase